MSLTHEDSDQVSYLIIMKSQNNLMRHSYVLCQPDDQRTANSHATNIECYELEWLFNTALIVKDCILVLTEIYGAFIDAITTTFLTNKWEWYRYLDNLYSNPNWMSSSRWAE